MLLTVSTYNPAYAETVALTIPVFFIAIAVDLRTLKPRAGDTRHAALLLTIIVAFVVAEIESLSSLANRTPLDGFDKFIVGFALLWGAVLMLVRVVQPIYTVLARSPVGLAMWVVFIYTALITFVLGAIGVFTLRTAVVISTVTLLVLVFLGVGTNETIQPLLQRAMRRWLGPRVSDEILCAISASKDKNRASLRRMTRLDAEELAHDLDRAIWFGYVIWRIDGSFDNGDDMEYWGLTKAGKARVAQLVDAARPKAPSTGSAQRLRQPPESTASRAEPAGRGTAAATPRQDSAIRPPSAATDKSRRRP